MSPRATFLPRLARPNNSKTWLTPANYDDALAAAEIKEKMELRRKTQHQKTKWQHADCGFAYASGPVIHKRWHQFTLRDAAVLVGQWLTLYLLIVIFVYALECFCTA